MTKYMMSTQPSSVMTWKGQEKEESAQRMKGRPGLIQLNGKITTSVKSSWIAQVLQL